MTTIRYALEPNGPKRLVISWGFGGWRNITIQLDDQTIGSIPGEKELRAGQEFHLPDGSVLKVQLVGIQLKVYRNEKPVPGSPADPNQKLKQAYYLIFLTAGFSFVNSLDPANRISWIVNGLVFLALGFFVTRRSSFALVIAILLYAINAISRILGSTNIFGLGTILFAVLSFFILAWMYQGLKAIKEIKDNSPAGRTLDPAGAQSETATKRPPPKLARSIGIGCLAFVLLIGVGFAGLFFSGILSGPHGDRDEVPAWSPDGSHIAFMSNRDGFSDIYVMNTDGSNVVQLTRDRLADLYFTQSPTDTTPAWSPDGKKIAFASGRDNGMMTYIDLNIYSMKADGSGVIKLTRRDSVDQAPAWSPDGKQIAYTVAEAFARGAGGGQLLQNPTWDIRVMNADGSNDTQLTNDPANEYGIAWSPDSSHIAFVSEINGSADLYVMKSDGSNVVQLTSDPTNEGSPAWSLDGNRIAFVSDRDGKTAIFVMNADGSNILQLTDGKSNAFHPSWSPDGKTIVFASDSDGDDDIYVMKADGSNIVQLTGK